MDCEQHREHGMLRGYKPLLAATLLIFYIQAAPAPTPTLDKRMQKWLDRWKD